MRAATLLRLAAVLFGLAALYAWGRPSLLGERGFGGAVYDRHGALLRLSLAADERYRLPVTLDQIAPAAVEATLLYEDRWFRWHPGVNPWALGEAAVEAALGGRRRGASTITMQLARLRFGIETGTLSGKLVQMLRALQLELYYGKSQILAAYYTLAPYGGNIEGIAAASRIYFDKPPAALSLAEGLALAVMPQRPSARGPTADGREPAAMQEARGRLARTWLEAHPETSAAEVGLSAPLALRRRQDLPFFAPHVALRLAGGAQVVTTLDLELQTLLERRVRAFVGRHGLRGIDNVAVMLLDHRSMEVLAALGSADFADEDILGQVDGTRAKRSPGSALKPFIYGLAIEEGLIHPRSLLKDAPMRFGAYNPENFDGEFVGPISASEALVRSRNVPAVFLETELRRRAALRGGGVGGLYDLLRRAGVQGLSPPEHYGLALVLGGLEVSMEELVELYAMLARNGNAAPLAYEVGPAPRGRQVLSPEAAALTLEMLREGGGALDLERAWVRDELPVAWKTGTSYGFRDAWTVGVVGPLVLAVWIGHFEGRGNPAFVGRRAAAPLFFEIVEALRPTLQAAPHPAGPELRIDAVEVCAVSGQMPGAHCPRTTSTHFIPGTSPIASCEVHREVQLDADGRRACPGEVGATARVLEFWPSDLLRLFEQAGLPRRRPPPYAARCGVAERAEQGKAPSITSPQPDVVYNLRAHGLGREEIPLSATADADVEILRWFIGERYVGSARRGEPFLWRAQPGDFVVRVVDDSGRADARPVRIALVE